MVALNSLTVYMLIAHFLADYQLQSQKLVTAKHESVLALLKHSVIHVLLLLPMWIISGVYSRASLGSFSIFALIIFATHFIIDYWKIFFTRRYPKNRGAYYIADQLAHIAIIYIFSEHIFVNLQNAFTQYSFYNQSNLILKWILLIVIITKPTNISFKELFGHFQIVANEKDKDEESSDMGGAGAIIGNIERILSAIFLATGNIASIALIYTAKSIARFKQMEDKNFAEYYLIGTLFSIMTVVLVYIILFGVI